MNQNPLVSVAIITYNQKEFLREAIESVLNQDYEPIEIVVGDDCSTDGSQQLLKEYEIKYPGKFVLELASTNRGITANSNAVHFACHGKYIAWLGGDDIMLPGKIKKQVAFLEKHPDHNIVYHNLDVFDSATNKSLRSYNSGKDIHTGDVTKLIQYGTFNGACASMVRRSSSPSHGFDNRLPVASDWMYWIEHLENGGKIGYLPEVLGRHRRHGGNVSGENSAFRKQGLADTFKTLDIVQSKFPSYKKIIDYRRSALFWGLRKSAESYQDSLIRSVKFNPLNYKAVLVFLIYTFSFHKIKL